MELVFKIVVGIFGEEETKIISFMSDRHKGIINALKHHFLYDNYKFCGRHMYANFKIKYPGL